MKRNNYTVSVEFYEQPRGAVKESCEEAAKDLRRNVLPALARRAQGRTLMLGWSDTLRLTPPQADHFVALDFAHRVLRRVPGRPNLSRVCAEAVQLPFDRGTFDTVFMTGLIHHLAEDTPMLSDRMMSRILTEVARVMKRDTRLYVLEPFVPSGVEVLNRVFFSAARRVMNMRGMPMVCFYSVGNFRVALDNNNLELLYVTPVEFDCKVPAGWMKPGARVSPALMPQKVKLLEIRKKHQA